MRSYNRFSSERYWIFSQSPRKMRRIAPANSSSRRTLRTFFFERGFRPIRYFRRASDAGVQRSQVLSMAAFYETANDPNDPADRTRDFLERYLRLTHCDLFFADAAILVEGNVERLLMPQMIAKAATRLQSSYLSILEIGGAFGHRFKGLIGFWA